MNFALVSCRIGRSTKLFGCCWYSTTQFHISFIQIFRPIFSFLFFTLGQNFSRFRGLSINDENKKGFWSVGRAANEKRRGSVGTFYSARSLAKFFPLDFEERSLAEIDKTLKGHLVRAHFLQGYNFNPRVTLK